MKKIGILALVLVFALGSLGVGYAMWDKTLYIDGTVNTGSLDATWTQEDPYDSEPAEKDVSWAECYIDGDTMYITIYNAYPSIVYSIPIDVHNSGTIPFHITGLVVTSSNLPACSTVTVPDWTCTQLHPCEEAAGTVTVHLCNAAEQNSTYNFTAELRVVQWNEAP